MLTVETAEAMIESSRPTRRFWGPRNLILLGASMILGAMLAKPEWMRQGGVLTWLIPQIMLLVMVGMAMWSATRQKRRSRLMLDAFEGVQLQDWPRAQDALLQLLQRPIHHRAARAESLMALATVAEADRDFETSQRIYEAVLAEGEADPLQLHTTRVALASAMLRNGQTADAIALIDRFTRSELPAPLRAQIQMLALYREIVMGQTEDGLADAEKREQLFRNHLSTRAGYGYALLATAFDRFGNTEKARKLWHKATLLVRPDDLINRFEEVEKTADKYPNAEVAL